MKTISIAAAGIIYGLLFAISASATPGDLDPDFGTDGVATLSSGTNRGFASALQGDGKIVVAGDSDGTDSFVARFNSDGSLDTGFGSGGTVQTSVASNSDLFFGVLVQSDGKILCVGRAREGSGDPFEVSLVRYLSDGTPDTSFSGDGMTTTDAGTSSDVGRAVVLQSDGKILVAGYSSNGSDNDLLVLRYNSDGTLDTTFNGSGIVIHDGGFGEDQGRSLAVQTDGKILVAGSTITQGGTEEMVVIRLNFDGSYDAGFGTGGALISPVGTDRSYATNVLLQDDGKFILAGGSGDRRSHFSLVRHNADGAIDTSFGTDGSTTIEMDRRRNGSANNAVLMDDGRIVMVGRFEPTNGEFDMAVARFTPDGSLDYSLANTGIVWNPNEYGNSVEVQDDGKIVVAGYASRVLAVRFLDSPSPPSPTTITPLRSETGATLRGEVLANGADTTVHFEYGPTAAYGSTTAGESIGTTPVTVGHVITGLIPGATYHYRVVATNSVGTVYGDDISFMALQPRRYEKMAIFSEASGFRPIGGMVEGADGILYGVTQEGGDSGLGTIYSVTPEGVLDTIIHFQGFDGSSPNGRLLQTSDGSFYGLTGKGGDEDLGTVFRLADDGSFSSLRSFYSGSGVAPGPHLIQASNGYLYGKLASTTGPGNIINSKSGAFRLSTSGQYDPLVIGNGILGESNTVPFVQALDGNLYSYHNSALIRMSPAGAVTTAGGIPGGARGRLIVGKDGYLYGAANATSELPYGSVFRVSTSGGAELVASLSGTDGANPRDVFQDDDGSFLVTCSSGGDFDKGTIVRIGTDTSITVLHHFAADAGSPNEELMRASDGNYYFTDSQSLYRMTPAGDVTELVRFTGSNHHLRRAGLVEAADGTLLLSTGGSDDGRSGNVYTVSAAGRMSAYGNLDPGIGLGDPGAPLLEAQDGFFYGMSESGGANDLGTVFRIESDGTATVLVDFAGADGASPVAGLTEGPDGNLYGTTRDGGSANLGTVFRVSTAGAFSVLHHFSGADGSSPLSRMAVGIDGNLYGTTSEGGSAGSGTVFRLIPGTGSLTTVTNFTGPDGASPNELLPMPDGGFLATSRLGGTSDLGTVFHLSAGGTITTLHHFSGADGQWPESPLSEAPDGTIWGTTSAGATNDRGTLFKLTPGNLFVGVIDFGSVPDGKPTGPVFFGQDGNLYGTTRNSVFRLLFPGAPIADPGEARDLTSTSAVIDASINGRGSSTVATIEYGTDGMNFPFSVTAAPLNVNGFITTAVGATLSGLDSGKRYYYRLRAQSSAGTTLSEVATFATHALPSAIPSAATGLGPTSATLNGTVNPFENPTTVDFEFGTDGNVFPFSIAATPANISGNSDVPVSAAIAGLTKGVTYYFRIRASNAEGTTVSGTLSFQTLIEPLATTGGATAVSTTRARVEGTVDARGANTQAFFEYGTVQGVYPNIVAALPGLVSGNGVTPVLAEIPNLNQGVTYYYRVRAASAGGISYGGEQSFEMNVLSGFDQVRPGAPPNAQGFVIVNVSPGGILTGWRFVGERQWRASGVPVGGLTTGDREIEFRPVPGYIHPPTETISITSGGAATVTNRFYYETEVDGTGGITVTLKPDDIATGPGRAQWRLLGEDDSAWRDSGTTLSALPPGAYLVECKDVAGRVTPPNANVLVSEGQTAAATLTYFLASTAGGEEPGPLAFETVTDDTSKPYAWVGQIRSNVGLSTGFAVKERVVATAAHVVWDEGTLSAVEGMQWLHQRHAGSYEPTPQDPRGFYLLSGYAAQRQAEGTPGSFSPESRNLDVAAIYLTEDAARGGYSGFLASDLNNNEFLLSDADKLLVGYPVDGISSGSRGKMHATSPFDVMFTPVGATANRTFLTTDIRSSGGASGGPLCVQFEGGAFYPAAVYLGGDTQSLVRAIDSDVIDLFDRAELSGIDGQPHTGGGITHSNVTVIGGSSTPGALSVTLRPPAANNAGGWRLKPETDYLASGVQQNGLNAGRYVLELLPVDGFQLPASQRVRIRGGELTDLTFTYVREPSPATVGIRVTGRGQAIANGDTSPSATDDTDFGVVEVGMGETTRTFTIENTGTAEMSVGTVGISGAGSGDFSVSMAPGDTVPAGGTTSFMIRFAPTDTGTRTATVSFANNSGETPFEFTIQGNETTDTDGNGFSDVEEAGLQELLRLFFIGEDIGELDLGFLRVGASQMVEIAGLPPGLNYDPGTGRITGTPTGPAGGVPEIRKVDGMTIDAMLAFPMDVREPPRMNLSKVRSFGKVRVRKKSRPQTIVITNAGGVPLTGLRVLRSGKAAKDYLLTPPGASELDEGDATNFRVTFRPGKRGKRKATVTVFSNEATRRVTLVGKGK